MKNYCKQCGHELKQGAMFCPECGSKTGEYELVKEVHTISTSNQTQERKEINPIIAAIVGFFVPGLPALIWFNQKKKGVVMLIVVAIAAILLSGLGVLVTSIFGVIDAYTLAIRVNTGGNLDEWDFFWSNK